jgi:hypothetical protein
MAEARAVAEAGLDSETAGELYLAVGASIPWICERGRVAAFDLLVRIGTQTLAFLLEGSDETVHAKAIEQWTTHVLARVADADAGFREAPEVLEAARLLEQLRAR